ncbi:MAG: GLPGLI family protein [Bacteroidetes bacterium]|nr:GLPGLI family protein [Bacteroidota bacterium]
MKLNKALYIIKISCILILSLYVNQSFSQIYNAKIEYERRANLYKLFKDDNIKNWIKEEDKIKTEYFELYFNDSMSVFKPIENELKDNTDWATKKNTVYQNLKSNKRISKKIMWGEELSLKDSLFNRKWKITDGTRKIAGFECRKAMWQANDTTKIYAWFSYDIVTPVGPESFTGLPGTILGLATENGSVVYFAKKITVNTCIPENLVVPKIKHLKESNQIKEELQKQYGKEKWFKNSMFELFDLW